MVIEQINTKLECDADISIIKWSLFQTLSKNTEKKSIVTNEMELQTAKFKARKNLNSYLTARTLTN